jgi:hypothetical protein
MIGSTLDPKLCVLMMRHPQSLVEVRGLQGNEVHSLVDADVDGDGRPEVLRSTWYPSGVSIVVDPLQGARERELFVDGVSKLPWSVAAADLDGDGTDEVIVSTYRMSGVTVIHNGRKLMPGDVR